MSFANALYLVGVLCAFVAFMALVAWGQYFTRHVSRDRATTPKSASGIETLQRAAEAAEAREQQEPPPQPLSAVL